tara:strand:- start:414 stop:572 length:159 start_codon:yes stop_codon:yes gene_type:complete
MATETHVFINGEQLKSHVWSTELEAKQYKKGVLRAFTVKEIRENQIEIIISK